MNLIKDFRKFQCENKLPQDQSSSQEVSDYCNFQISPTNDILLDYFITVNNLDKKLSRNSITINKKNKVKGNQNSELTPNGLILLSEGYINNPMIAYLNKNSLVSKIKSLADICESYPIHLFCIDEIELYPPSHFK